MIINLLLSIHIYLLFLFIYYNDNYVRFNLSNPINDKTTYK